MAPSAVQPPAYRLFVGIDIAADSATVSWVCADDGEPSDPIVIQQDAEGLSSLEQQLISTRLAPAQILVVMEATGCYWISLATRLHRDGFAVSVINPAQAHYFAKSLLRRAKSDAIDAQILAQLGCALKPAPWNPPPAIYEELHQRLAHRESLLAIRQQLRNQLHALEHRPRVIESVRRQLERLIETLDKGIAEVEKELEGAIREDAAWEEAAARLRSIPGIGLLTAAWLLSSTLNFSVCASGEAAASYAGLVPMERSSGASVRGRASIGHSGNGALRRALYLATVSAVRFNPAIKPFYERLITRGKPMKVARCAAARKLLRLAWAVATKTGLFDPDYAKHSTLQLNKP